MGVVAIVQSLVHHASWCMHMCDSDESLLKKCLLTNAAQPIFSARNEAIGWEEAYDIHVAIHHAPVKPIELEKFFYSQLQKPAKEESL